MRNIAPAVALACALIVTTAVGPAEPASRAAAPNGAPDTSKVVRVFIFAGQSNMVGADSKVSDIRRFPPFARLDEPQRGVAFSYCIGRENKRRSDGWTDLQPVAGWVGPELSFARKARARTGAPIAIIKCAAGGTHLGGDWNPDAPTGFRMYPLALELVRSSLAALERQGLRYRLEGFVWHQGENDMFEEEYLRNYGRNLSRFIACWRRDLGAPNLRFYIGELCTKTIWGMDLRPRMYAISLGQKQVTETDPLTEYVPTNHIAVEIGRDVGLHYHYGTLGQLEHGVNYADAHLRTIGKADDRSRPLEPWPFSKGSPVRLFVLAGHRNMEGERAFVADLARTKAGKITCADDPGVPYRYSLGGGVWISDGWEPLGAAGYYSTFGPELSFARTLRRARAGDIAIAKFTHSGSQIVDWTPEGSVAKSRNLYPEFIAFIEESVRDLEARGHTVELAGIFYHLGENDMSFAPFRRAAIARLHSFVEASRRDLGRPDLRWYVSQQRPTRRESLDAIDVTADLIALDEADPHLTRVPVFDLPGQEQELVITTPGMVELGVRLARRYLDDR